MRIALPPKPAVEYPEDDGLPMAENTLQYEWIVTIKGGLDAVFQDDANVFVAGDLLWYPVEGDNTTRQAPDVMVAFGRPKGYRGSYRQWDEGGIGPQVVFEILSPGNRAGELLRKFQFYERFGVEEYYIYDPHSNVLSGYLREGDKLQEIANIRGWVSPRLKVRFEVREDTLELIGPDGRRFLTFVELAAQAKQAETRAEQAETRAEQLAARLRALGIDPDA